MMSHTTVQGESDQYRPALESKLLPSIYPIRTPLELSAFDVRGEPISYEAAIRADYRPFRTGDPWGAPWSTTWFHVQGRVPADWSGKVVALFDLGFDGPTGFTCEALAWKDGKPWRGVDPNHRWLPIDGPEVDFYLEAAANPRATEAGSEPAPSMLALRRSAEPAFVLRMAELAIRDWPEEGTGHVRLDPVHRITAVGHAHIDTAWEWPIREAKRKVARSWSTQLALMDEHPDYVFAASQPVQYAWMKESYPDIYRRIKEKVTSGQWEPVGAMWV
jgi:alpha-mannosidase